MKWNLFNSIQHRLIISISLMVTVILSVSSLCIYDQVKEKLMSQLDVRLKAEAFLILVEIELDDGVIEHDWLIDVEHQKEGRADDFIQVWDLKSGVSTKSPSLAEAGLEPFYGDLDEMTFQTITLPNGHAARAVGVMIYPTVPISYTHSVQPKQKPQILVLAHDSEWLRTSLKELKIYFIVAAILINLAIVLAVFLMIRVSLTPIHKVSSALCEIDPYDVDSHLKIPTRLPTELRGLVEEYRALIERVNKVRRRERIFTSNIAHELRTPIAGILTTVEACVNRERSCPEYLKTLSKVTSIGENMKLLTERIMSLVHLENGVEELQLIDIPLNELIQAVADAECEVQHESETRIHWDLSQDRVVQSDPSYLSVLLRNIISNAIHYSCDHSVSISSQFIGEHSHIEVKNISQHLDSETLEHLHEPFYRADSSRALDGHAGLGLPLCFEISRLLGITLSLKLSENNEFIATIIIPNAP